MAKAAAAAGIATGQCLCGKVSFEIDVPARWAWHDHSASSRRAHGAAYATYVGSWKKRFRITSGKTALIRYEDKGTKTARSFCSHCGTPITYERPGGPHMVNIPRALFKERTGRQPLYHIAIEELQEWTYTGEPLVPLKGFPGVVWQRWKERVAKIRSNWGGRRCSAARPRNAAMTALPCAPPRTSAIMPPCLRQRPLPEET
ncbi:GFA family protein [Bradyrhizobium guangdongense]|uniref:Aldehyde-activating protein n=1 Tax=Bradyrhizobium guangdongense TaxID=1325090 RepID=A0A410VDX2_9BRAD|nr:GFA family protein [Bradyrhizobium guangdongense]QAU41837.1 GFA family protein [Bradyrhizobium guangdongense]QOZ64105.1 GFA family protein [Bradyrhizobium guangdongense]GGI24622.1 aldehyde-activating protein [Bradyrhizobium guangdongense]